MRKTIYTSLFLVLISLNLKAVAFDKQTKNQSILLNTYAVKGGYKPNLDLKINLAALAANTFSTQAEFAFAKRFSVACGFSVSIPVKLSDKIINYYNTKDLSGVSVTGYSITPEIRYYPGPKILHQAPYGFYIAPYFKINNLEVNAKQKVNSTDPYTGLTTETTQDFSLALKGNGAGFMFGSQWVIKKHITIDWWIAGIHYAVGNFTAKATSSQIATLSTQDINNLKSDISHTQLGTPVITRNGSTLNVEFPKSGFVGLRAGLCFGYKF